MNLKYFLAKNFRLQPLQCAHTQPDERNKSKDCPSMLHTISLVYAKIFIILTYIPCHSACFRRKCNQIEKLDYPGILLSPPSLVADAQLCDPCLVW